MKIQYIILALLLSVPCLLPVASADIPSLLHEFRGTVTINDTSAPDGTLVSATILGRTVKATDQNPVETVNGTYGIDGLSLLVQGGDLEEGDMIRFFVDEVYTGQTYKFEYKGGPTWMNLSVTIEDDPDQDPESVLPIADAGGPYEGYIGFSILFTGEASSHPDPNGTIVGYRWDYTGDGTWDTDWLTSFTMSQVYDEAGEHTLTLQVKDNNDATDTDTTTVTVLSVVMPNASNETLAFLFDYFGLDLTEPFQAIDATGDGIVDTFLDPNDLVYFIRSAIVDGDDIFLLSSEDGDMPEFFWNPATDEIIPVTSTTAELPEHVIDEDAKEIIFEITVKKADWIYIKLIDPYPPDEYPNFSLTVTTADGRVISPDFIWREDGFIYVLDDPETQYMFIYAYDELPDELQPLDPIVSDELHPLDPIVSDELHPLDSIVPDPDEEIPWLFILLGIIVAIIILLLVLVKTGKINFKHEEE